MIRGWLCLGLLPVAALAQATPADDLQDFQSTLEQPVQAANKRVQRLKEAPADVTVLRGQELRELGYRTLGEALGGVLAFQTSQDRAYTGLAVRGLYVLGDQNTRVLVLLDGHPLNSPAEVGSSKVGEDFGIPLDLVERIEVIRGPASSLHGNNSFLGTVNVVTREPAERPLGGEVLATASSRTLVGLDSVLGGTAGSNRWQVLVSGMQRSGSATAFPELDPERLPAGLDREERQSAYLRAAGPDWSCAGYTGSRTQRLASAPFNATIGSPGNRYVNRLTFGDCRWTPTFGAVETLVRVYGDRNEFFAGLDYDGTRQAGVQGSYAESDPDWSLGLELQGRVKVGNSLLFTLGHERSWHHYDSQAGIAPDLALLHVRYQLGSSYLQAEWSPLETLTATAALQLAEFSVSAADARISGQDSTGGAPSSLTGVTPRLALVWQPTSVDILKALFAGGYRNPTIFERYYTDVTTFVPNPDLRPERIQTLQGLWVRNWATGLQSQLSASRSWWRHLVAPQDLGGGLQQFRNQGEELSGTSLEAEIQGRWGVWSAYAEAGAYRWQQDRANFPDSTAFQGAIRVTRHWRTLSASAELRQLGAREPASGGAGAPASTVLRLAARWEGSHLWLRGTLEDAGQARRTDPVATDYLPITQMSADGRTCLLTLGLPF